jgi:hypothetical protein
LFLAAHVQIDASSFISSPSRSITVDGDHDTFYTTINKRRFSCFSSDGEVIENYVNQRFRVVPSAFDQVEE